MVLANFHVFRPFWYRMVEETKYCHQYWWANLLYINNFVPEEYHQMCMAWSWYGTRTACYVCVVWLGVPCMAWSWSRKFNDILLHMYTRIVTAHPQHSHSTVTAQSRHSHTG